MAGLTLIQHNFKLIKEKNYVLYVRNMDKSSATLGDLVFLHLESIEMVQTWSFFTWNVILVYFLNVFLTLCNFVVQLCTSDDFLKAPVHHLWSSFHETSIAD